MADGADSNVTPLDTRRAQATSDAPESPPTEAEAAPAAAPGPASDRNPDDAGPPEPSDKRASNAGDDAAVLFGSVQRDVVEAWIRKAREEADATRKWYDSRASKMGKWSRRLRQAAVLLAVLGGLCPLLPEKLIERWFGDVAPPAVSQAGFILIALAAGAVLLDQAFGYSSSWMRSRLAELELGRIIGSYGVKFDSALGSLGTSVTRDDADRVVSLLARFVEDINDVSIVETRTWVSEFKSGLTQIDRIVNSNRTGAGGSNAGKPS